VKNRTIFVLTKPHLNSLKIRNRTVFSLRRARVSATPEDIENAEKKVKGMRCHFRSYDPRSIGWYLSRPGLEWIALSSPVIVTHKAAMMCDAFDYIMESSEHSANANQIANSFAKRYSKNFSRRLAAAMTRQEFQARSMLIQTQTQDIREAFGHTGIQKTLFDAWKDGLKKRHKFSKSDLGICEPPSADYIRHIIKAHLRSNVEYESCWREENIGGTRLQLDWSRKGGKGVHLGNVHV